MPRRITLPASIRTPRDVYRLSDMLHRLDCAFHWDDDPADMVHVRTGEPTFDADTATQIGALIDQCFAVSDDPFAHALNSLVVHGVITPQEA
jgi:hypothetical protein